MSTTQDMLDTLKEGFETNVDIVFVIDATGSMQPVIDMVKNSAITFRSEVEKRLLEARRYVKNMRIKVITFRDYYCDGRYAYDESDFFELPNEAEKFEEFVRDIEARGGGDEPENSLEALVKAMRSDFVADGEKRRHIIVLFTDASAHPFEERNQLIEKAKSEGLNPIYPENMPDSLEEFRRMWNFDDQDGQGRCGGLDRDSRRLVVFAPDDAYPWSTDFSAQFDNVQIEPLKAGEGGKEINMENVYPLIVKSMGGSDSEYLG